MLAFVLERLDALKDPVEVTKQYLRVIGNCVSDNGQYIKNPKTGISLTRLLRRDPRGRCRLFREDNHMPSKR